MNKLQSRKFWLTVIGSIVTLAAAAGLQVRPELSLALATLLWATYIIAEAIIDATRTNRRG